MKSFALLALLFVPLNMTLAQEAGSAETPPAEAAESADQNPEAAEGTEAEPPTTETAAPAADDPLDQARDSATGLVDDAKERVGDLADSLDQNRSVQDVSTSLLHPIYIAAETLSFPAFHWLAFALMGAGVVSYALQLVLGKLVVLTKGSINVREILSDTVGLLISAIGLVLTTQAATENSTFPNSPTSVLSSAAAGIVLGFILYIWNQREEVQAARGRKHQKD